jgi:hypothetical protein
LDVADKSILATVKQVCVFRESKLFYQRCRFRNLADWEPVLYVNTHDYFCNEYMTTTFTDRIMARTWSTLTCKRVWVGRHIGVIGGGRRCNVVPTVRKDRPHDLKQWYNDDALREPVKKRYQLEVVYNAVSICWIPTIEVGDKYRHSCFRYWRQL